MFLLKVSFLFISLILIQRTVSYSKSKSTDICSPWKEDWKTDQELRNQILTDVALAGGSNAGKYAKVKVNNWYDCVAQCCLFSRCNVAFWVSSTCVHVECISDDLCEPVPLEDNKETNEQTLFVRVRSVRNTAAAIDYEDPGRDECNQTKTCEINERCQQVMINAEVKRFVCLCDRENGFRRINGVCRQYVSHSRPCSLNEKFNEKFDELTNDFDNRGRCRENEECLPPNDRAKHGYCQCKLGYLRSNEDELCTMTQSTSTISSSIMEIEVEAGDDQTIVLPKSQVDLNGKASFKSNGTSIDKSILKNNSWNLVWTVKSSDANNQVDIIPDQDSPFHAIVKNLGIGVYQFALELINRDGLLMSVDQVQVEVKSEKTTPAPLFLKVKSIVTVNLPQQIVSLQATVEPSTRTVKYHWNYMKDGPITPSLENTETSELLISNLRPGNYSFTVRINDDITHEQSQVVHLIAVGEPISARVSNIREIVFWPSNDVLLDGTSSIIEPETNIVWSLLSTDNQRTSDEIEIHSPHSLKTRVSHLNIGQYRFQLTLRTVDDRFTSKIEVLVIVYAQNGRPPKIHIELETPNVNIFNNLIILNGSETTADYGISRWQWMKSSSSPALGNFINNSDISPIAYLTNLIEGQYVFNLQVIDDRQQMSEANISVKVNGIPDAKNLIEVRFISKPFLYEQSLENLIVQIRVFLIDLFPNVHIDKVAITNNNLLLIKAIDTKTNTILSPKSIADHLRTKLKPLRAASNMNIISTDTFLCLSNCSNHGQCDHSTKRCVCNRYYMENWFRSLIRREPNCDFLIHYFVLFVVVGSLLFFGFCCCCLCCCLRWKRRQYLLERRKRIRYQLLHENDEDEDEELSQFSNDSPLKDKHKGVRQKKTDKNKQSSMIMSESDNDLSDTNGEQTLYDKPLLTNKSRMHASSSKHRGLRVPVQDSNNSPVLTNNGQKRSPNDNSMA